MTSSYSNLLKLWGEIADIGSASAVLSWDQETYMPKKGAEARGKILGTLAGVRHAKLTASVLRDTIEKSREEVDPSSIEASQVERASYEVEQASLIPSDLAKAIAEGQSKGLMSWQNARENIDFNLFKDSLSNLVSLNKEKASALDGDAAPYDVMLNLYEEGVTEKQLEPIFDQFKKELSPLVKAVSEAEPVDEKCVQGHFPPNQQEEFALLVAKSIGYDMKAGRLDATTHPFCTTFGLNDVRITWRWLENDIRPALYGVIHEAGHGLYEQGLPADWARTPLYHATGLGMHESQSRLWENMVGRSAGFWEWAMPHFRKTFLNHGLCSVSEMVRALNTCRPTLIRVEADEATYNLHVAARFEIERQLFSNSVEVVDLPELWCQTYKNLLGVEPKDVSEGVLQDIHWAMGAFGYFPTYSIGNIISTQLYYAAEAALECNLEEQFSRGDFKPLLGWLRENIHCHGRRFSTNELLLRSTGHDLSPSYLINHIKSRVTASYNL